MMVIGLSYFMVILDVQIVNVVLSTVQRELGAAVAGLYWIVDGYALLTGMRIALGLAGGVYLSGPLMTHRRA